MQCLFIFKYFPSNNVLIHENIQILPNDIVHAVVILNEMYIQ